MRPASSSVRRAGPSVRMAADVTVPDLLKQTEKLKLLSTVSGSRAAGRVCVAERIVCLALVLRPGLLWPASRLCRGGIMHCWD